jgi:hypothetical protein
MSVPALFNPPSITWQLHLLYNKQTNTISAHRASSSSNQLGLPYPFFAVVGVGVIDFLPFGSGSLVYFTVGVGVGVADGDGDTGIGRRDFIVLLSASMRVARRDALRIVDLTSVRNAVRGGGDVVDDDDDGCAADGRDREREVDEEREEFQSGGIVRWRLGRAADLVFVGSFAGVTSGGCGCGCGESEAGAESDDAGESAEQMVLGGEIESADTAGEST